MADHRKTFRPRHLVLGASLLLVGSILPALAEDAGLKNGAASLAAGKYDNAVRQLSSTINAENAVAAEAARALYLRGIAYRKLGQPARAISDLGAAIFLGLPDEDRVKALVNRGLAYQAAGLPSQGDAEIAQARGVGGSGAVDQLIADGGGTPAGAASVASSTSVSSDAQGSSATENPTRTAGASGQWTTTASADTGAAGASSGNRVSRWFGSLTGSSSSPPPTEPVSAPAESSAAAIPAPSKPPAAPSTGWGAQTQAGETAAASSPPPSPSSPPPAPSTGWGAKTQGGDTVVASDASPSQSRWSRWFSKTAEADQTAQPPPAPATGGRGGFQLQLATSRSEGDAQALWKQVSSANTGLSGKSPDIEKVDIGNFGTFYSLKVGPFPDKAESLKVCNALKRNGVDCSVVSPEAH